MDLGWEICNESNCWMKRTDVYRFRRLPTSCMDGGRVEQKRSWSAEVPPEGRLAIGPAPGFSSLIHWSFLSETLLFSVVYEHKGRVEKSLEKKKVEWKEERTSQCWSQSNNLLDTFSSVFSQLFTICLFYSFINATLIFAIPIQVDARGREKGQTLKL